jgi:hypothetical protein
MLSEGEDRPKLEWWPIALQEQGFELLSKQLTVFRQWQTCSIRTKEEALQHSNFKLNLGAAEMGVCWR